MKKYKLYAIILSILFILVGCNKTTNSDVTSTADNIKHMVFISSSVPWGELESNGYINKTDSAEYVDANKYLNFDIKLSSVGVDNTVTEYSKRILFNGKSYDVTYKESEFYTPLSSDIKAFNNDTTYDVYVLNEGADDEVEVTYNRTTGKIHRIDFVAKDIEPNDDFTHEMAIAEADKLLLQFTDEPLNDYRCNVGDVKHETRFIRVQYTRTIHGYKTEQAIFVDFNNDGSLKSIINGKIGFFSISRCQIGALDYYEKLLSKELIQSAENEMKKICPEDVFENGSRIIGFDSNGNCLLHMPYFLEDGTLVKYYVNLFELSEETYVVAK